MLYAAPLFALCVAMSGCSIAKPDTQAGTPELIKLDQPAATSPYLLGLKFPIKPTGGFAFLFNSQLSGIKVKDARGVEFSLIFPSVLSRDLYLDLQISDDPSGWVTLFPGDEPERLILEQLRPAL